MRLSSDGTLIEVSDNDILNGFFEIPSGVTSIGHSAFRCCKNLKQITIPKGVTSIGHSAFLGCKNLQQITIPDSVISIGPNAFWNCKNLHQITIPDSVTSIGSHAFWACENLQQITIPKGVTSIGDSTFDGCKNLQQITIPDSVTSIGDYAFFDCKKLQQITLPDSLTSIGSRIFHGCDVLKNIFIDCVDETKRENLIQLLPEHLRKKVVIYSPSELTTLWKQELRRIINTVEMNPLYSLPGMAEAGLPNEILIKVNFFVVPNNSGYQKLLGDIKKVPLPMQDGIGTKKDYEATIKNIVNKYISQEEQPSESNNSGNDLK